MYLRLFVIYISELNINRIGLANGECYVYRSKRKTTMQRFSEDELSFVELK